ncbi:hypothetical protein AB0E94_32110, partial [Actinoplanes sp. NPDC026670]
MSAVVAACRVQVPPRFDQPGRRFAAAAEHGGVAGPGRAGLGQPLHRLVVDPGLFGGVGEGRGQGLVLALPGRFGLLDPLLFEERQPFGVGVPGGLFDGGRLVRGRGGVVRRDGGPVRGGGGAGGGGGRVPGMVGGLLGGRGGRVGVGRGVPGGVVGLPRRHGRGGGVALGGG